MFQRPRLARTALIAICVFGFAAAIAAQQHAGSYMQADIERGALLYGAQCSACHGPEGDTVPNVDLRLDRFKLDSTDEDLARIITRGVPGTAMQAHRFTEPELFALIAYIRSMREFGARAVTLGDPRSGLQVFEARGCPACHRVNGKGSRFAADLSEIGAIPSGEALHRALLDFSWYSPSYSPRTGLFYVSAWDDYSTIFTRQQMDHVPGQRFMGGRARSATPPLRRGPINTWTEEAGHRAVIAIDPGTGERKWRYEMHDVTDAGILTTASDLLFSGGREGYFFALDARSGALLWRTTVGGQVSAAPITYQVGSRQHVAIAAGNALFAYALRE